MMIKKPKDVFPDLDRQKQIDEVVDFVLSAIEAQKVIKPKKRKWKCKVSDLPHSDKYTLKRFAITMRANGWLVKLKHKIIYVDGIFPLYDDRYVCVRW